MLSFERWEDLNLLGRVRRRADSCFGSGCLLSESVIELYDVLRVDCYRQIHACYDSPAPDPKILYRLWLRVPGLVDGVGCEDFRSDVSTAVYGRIEELRQCFT